MTPAEIDRLLAERGVRYDVSVEEFYDGNRLLEFDEVLGALVFIGGDTAVYFTGLTK